LGEKKLNQRRGKIAMNTNKKDLGGEEHKAAFQFVAASMQVLSASPDNPTTASKADFVNNKL
jgi:hypothetical protein